MKRTRDEHAGEPPRHGGVERSSSSKNATPFGQGIFTQERRASSHARWWPRGRAKPSAGGPPSPAPIETEPPAPRRILYQLLIVWGTNVIVFGFGLGIIYGWFTWLLNEEQWRWVYRMYAIELPLIGRFPQI